MTRVQVALLGFFVALVVDIVLGIGVVWAYVNNLGSNLITGLTIAAVVGVIVVLCAFGQAYESADKH